MIQAITLRGFCYGAELVRRLDQGLVIDLAYGNATTDIYAYLGAGVPPQSIYIIGPHGGEQGTNAAQSSWEAEASRAATLPAIEQPK